MGQIQRTLTDVPRDQVAIMPAWNAKHLAARGKRPKRSRGHECRCARSKDSPGSDFFAQRSNSVT
jgi:hypothetical protein